ncbi:MAG TPA: hypothetical protein PKD55_20860 [Bellilinea sp.]|nr:hypothetical protein [Bellilinea sp.]
MSTLQQTLIISAISIVVLFAAMALIWGLMVLLTNIFADRKAKVEEAAVAVPEKVDEAPVVAAEVSDNNALTAAIAAVAVALGLQKVQEASSTDLSETISGWQVAKRAGQYTKNAAVFGRKN